MNIKANPLTRVLLIDSRCEGVFCAGADLKERELMNTFETEMFVHSLRQTFHSLSVNESIYVFILMIVSDYSMSNNFNY